MRLRIIAAGKVREDFLRTAIDDYLSRLQRYLKIDEVEVTPGTGAKAQKAIRRAIPPRYELWVLDAKGRQPTSVELAQWLQTRMNQGIQGVACAIGGAEGLPKEISRSADLRLSLSKLTLPHRLARLVLAEQLYRAMTIIRGEPYNK